MRLLKDKGIEAAASENVSGDDAYIVTANTAAGEIVGYLRSFFSEFQFINLHPQGPLHVLVTAAGEVSDPTCNAVCQSLWILLLAGANQRL